VDLGRVLPVFLERLRNEITRVTAVKAFGVLAQAKLDVGLGREVQASGVTFLQAALTELCSFLRKSSRTLRQTSLTALDSIIISHSALLGASDVSNVLSELAPLITDVDLHVAHLVLVLCSSVIREMPQLAIPHVKRSILPKILELLQSSLLHGQALRALLVFLGHIVSQESSELNFDVIVAQLLSLTVSDGNIFQSKHAISTLSQAVGVCCTHSILAAKRVGMVAKFVAQLGTDGRVQQRMLALLCLGEIGRQNDLSAEANVIDAVTSEFASDDEDIKAAAAFALGNVTAGNLPEFVPHMLSKLKASNEYLMLHALKELIGSKQPQLKNYVGEMMPSLVTFAAHLEEGVRNVAAECLGRLIAVSAEVVVPQLKDLLAHLNAHIRATAVHSLRFAVAESGSSPLPPVLEHFLLKFLEALSDDDVAVRRAVLLALNCTAHNKPSAIRDLLPGLLPMLYKETIKRAELVHQVDLGPFKHTVDDGLELRKAAFESMDTLLSHCADKLDVTEFVLHLVHGLKDDHDIKILSHRMLIKLAASPSSGFLLAASLDLVADPLRATICATIKDGAIKQQVERHEDLVRSGMRAARALETVPGAEMNVKFDEFVRSALKVHPLYAKIEEE